MHNALSGIGIVRCNYVVCLMHTELYHDGARETDDEGCTEETVELEEQNGW